MVTAGVSDQIPLKAVTTKNRRQNPGQMYSGIFSGPVICKRTQLPALLQADDPIKPDDLILRVPSVHWSILKSTSFTTE